jgi:hypothetical protein
MMTTFVLFSFPSTHVRVYFMGGPGKAWRSLLWALHTDYDRISTLDTGYFDFSASIVPHCLLFFFSFFFCLFCECDLAYIDRYPSVDAPGFSCYGRRPIERALAMDLSSEFITYPSLFMHM